MNDKSANLIKVYTFVFNISSQNETDAHVNQENMMSKQGYSLFILLFPLFHSSLCKEQCAQWYLMGYASSFAC